MQGKRTYKLIESGIYRRQRPDGSFGSGYYVRAPRTVWTHCRTLAAARELRDSERVLRRKARRPLERQATGEQTLADAATEYLAAHEEDASYRDKARYIGEWLDVFGPGARLCDVSAQRVRRHLRTRRNQRPGQAARKCSPSLRNSLLSAIKNLLRFAVENGELPFNPLASVRQEQPGRQEEFALDAAAEERLLEVARRPPDPKSHRPLNPLLAVVIDLLLATGMRVGVLLSLDSRDVDFDAGTVTFRKKRTRTKGGTLVLPMTERMRSAFGLVRFRQGLVFAGLTYDGLYRQVRRCFRDAGLPTRRPLHALRHSFITNALDAGMDVRVVMEWVGHEDLRTTMRYTHVGGRHLREGARLLDVFRSECSQSVATNEGGVES